MEAITRKRKKSSPASGNVDRLELVKALDKAKVGMEGKGIADIENFVFLKDKIFCYSSRLCAIIDFTTGYQFSVNAEEFYKIVCSIKAKRISLRYLKATNKVRIESSSKGKKTKSEIACLETLEDDLSFFESIDPDLGPNLSDAKVLPKNFMEGIDYCSFNASRDDSQFILNCLYFVDKAIYSSDDLRISKFDLSKDLDDEFLIHYKAIDALKKVKLNSIYLSDSWAYFFDRDENIFGARLTNEEYEAKPEAIDKNFEFRGKQLKLPKEEFEEALDIVSIMVEKDEGSEYNDISIAYDDGEIKFTGRKEIGYAQAILQSNIEDKLKFRINPEFLKKVLEKSETMKVGKDRALIKMKNFKHLISLSRV
jgi:hypothetical protein